MNFLAKDLLCGLCGLCAGRAFYVAASIYSYMGWITNEMRFPRIWQLLGRGACVSSRPLFSSNFHRLERHFSSCHILNAILAHGFNTLNQCSPKADRNYHASTAFLASRASEDIPGHPGFPDSFCYMCYQESQQEWAMVICGARAGRQAEDELRAAWNPAFGFIGSMTW
jgi:hypothetical protein